MCLLKRHPKPGVAGKKHARSQSLPISPYPLQMVLTMDWDSFL